MFQKKVILAFIVIHGVRNQILIPFQVTCNCRLKLIKANFSFVWEEKRRIVKVALTRKH